MRLENNLGTDAIRQIVLRIAIPSMLAQFVSVCYSIVDRMYIGHIAEVGAEALGGVGVCGPIVTMIGSLSFLVGMGGAPIMSMQLGANRHEDAKRTMANCFMMLVAGSVLLTFILLWIKKPMLVLFGAGPSIFKYANEYFTVYVCGTLFALLATGMNQFIISQGFAKKGMFAVIIGSIVNISLDPIFIYGLHMGVQGAAIATVLSQLCSCVYVLHFLLSDKTLVHLSFKGYSLKIIRKVTTLGLSPFLIIALDNIMIIGLNMILQKYGGAQKGDFLITCGTIAQSFMLVVTMPLGGITGGTQTILAYNYGAGKQERVKEAQKHIFKLCLLYTGVMFVFAWTMSGLFVRLFTVDVRISSQAIFFIHLMSIGLLPLGIQYEIVDGFTALAHVELAFPLSIFRKAVFFACVFLFPLFLPIEYVFLSETISDILPPIVSIVVHKKYMTKILQYRMINV